MLVPWQKVTASAYPTYPSVQHTFHYFLTLFQYHKLSNDSDVQNPSGGKSSLGSSVSLAKSDSICIPHASGFTGLLQSGPGRI